MQVFSEINMLIYAYLPVVPVVVGCINKLKRRN